MSLSTYNKKGNFRNTAEPAGKKGPDNKFRFVIQRHQASRLHYDFRLELGGVLKSWAVPKGPSLNPSQKRLAVMVEDHPVDYIYFKGTIPVGNYGAGKVEIWDKGKFDPVDSRHNPLNQKQALQGLKKGELKFKLSGKKLKGEFVLVKLKTDEKSWLLIKHKDEHSTNTVYDAEEHAGPVKTQGTISSIKYGRAKKLKSYIKPMLATIHKTPFDDKDWLFEIKWDGYRAIAETGKEGVKFYSRNGIDFSERFTVIIQSLKKIKQKAVLDGEIVLFNENNLPDFQKLQHYENHLNYPLIYYVFDILQLDRRNLEKLSLEERKKKLKTILKSDSNIRYCDHIEKDGTAFLGKAKKQGLEGIIAKKKDSQYRRGYRSKQWLKIKTFRALKQ